MDLLLEVRNRQMLLIEKGGCFVRKRARRGIMGFADRCEGNYPRYLYGPALDGLRSQLNCPFTSDWFILRADKRRQQSWFRERPCRGRGAHSSDEVKAEAGEWKEEGKTDGERE